MLHDCKYLQGDSNVREAILLYSVSGSNPKAIIPHILFYGMYFKLEKCKNLKNDLKNGATPLKAQMCEPTDALILMAKCRL